MIQKVIFRDLGLIPYADAWSYQEKLFSENVQKKLEARRAEVAGNTPVKADTQDHLLFCEHPHVYTLGKSGSASHLLANEQLLEKINATYFPIDRGGDITYHGLGQIVGYPILDLENYYTDIHKYLRMLEEAVILTLADYGIASGRIDKLTGVWIDAGKPGMERKICALGIRCSRWITMHGFALNVNTDLNYFNYIVPCGITDKAVTSIEKELGVKQDMEEVKNVLKEKIATLFSIRFAEG